MYTVTGESLLAFKVAGGGTGGLEQIQELRDGVVDRYVAGFFARCFDVGSIRFWGPPIPGLFIYLPSKTHTQKLNN
jgi:hypothetical protein